MQSQIFKIIIAIIITAIVVGGGVYFWQNQTTNSQGEKIVKHYCQQSGGTFENDKCDCPSEFGADMYDKTNGQCQTTVGGPGGALGEQMNQHVGLKLELDDCEKNK